MLICTHFPSNSFTSCNVNFIPECKYTKGSWSECDANNEKRRIDTLMSNSPPDCQPTKTLIKKCRVPDANSKWLWSIVNNINYVGTLIAYRHIVFKLEKISVKNCARKQSNMCRPPPPKAITGITPKSQGWEGGGYIKNFRPPPTPYRL